MDIVELARRLIDIPSVTGEEGAVAELLEGILEETGLTVLRLPYDEERWSLLATRGEQSPRVLLCSHIDTVPPHFPSEVRDGLLHGRGACDAKGIIASMIGAAADLIDEKIDGFGLLLLIGEETDSHGARAANDQLAELGSQVVIVGEPTDSRWVRACKGAFSATVTFEGKAAHSAYPDEGDSAISRLIAAATAVERAEWGRSDDLGEATVNIGVVRGGRKPNVVPDAAEMELMIRTVDPAGVVLERLEATVRPHGGIVSKWSGGDPIQLDVPPGEEGIVVGFGTDAPYLGNLGSRMLYGPGSILLAHTAEERIGIDEIMAARETYRDVVRGLLSPE